VPLFGAILVRFRVPMVRFRPILVRVGVICAIFGRFGAIFGRFGAVFGRFGAILSRFGAVFGGFIIIFGRFSLDLAENCGQNGRFFEPARPFSRKFGRGKAPRLQNAEKDDQGHNHKYEIRACLGPKIERKMSENERKMSENPSKIG
jgi:hypothetical protein